VGIPAYPHDLPGQEENPASAQDESSMFAEGDDASAAEGDESLPPEGDDPSAAEGDETSAAEESAPVIDGEFEIQPYVLPDGSRHLTSIINKAENELILFGGLGDGPPFRQRR
jgi:hypothetical protein